MNTLKRYSIAALVVLAIVVAGLTLFNSSGAVWADEETITPPWVDDFGKGKTDGKVPPEVKTKEKEKPIGGCTKTNKDGSTETDVVYHDDKTGETTTIKYIKTKDKAGNPKTVWKIKIEKPGQPPKKITYDPEPGNETKTVQDDDKTPTTSKFNPKDDYKSLDIGYGPGVTIGEPPMLEYPKEKTGGSEGGTTETGGGGGKTKKEYGGGGKGGGLKYETGGGGNKKEIGGGGKGGGYTPETGGGGEGKTTREKVPPPKRKEPPRKMKLVTYGGPPPEIVIHFGERPKTTPEEYVHKNPTPTWDHGDGDEPKVPVEPNHPVYGEIVKEPKIPHNDEPHVTETVNIPENTYTEITPDGWIEIGSGWAYVRIPVSFVNDCYEQTQEKVPEKTTTGGGTGGQTGETVGEGTPINEPEQTQEAAKRMAREKEKLNPPPPPTQTKDDCGPWDGKYNPNGEGEAIKNARYDVALGEKRLAEATEWRSTDPDWVECAGYFLYDSFAGDPVRHAQDQLTRSKWQVEIYEAAYRAARARGVCNESAHFYGATALHNWIQEVRWDFIQRMTLWLQQLGSAILAAQVAQDIAANLGEISKAKDASAQKAAFDKSVARAKARMAANESGGGGVSSEGAGGAGRTGKGGTQVLGPGENPYAQEGGKGGTQKLGPGENPYAQEGGKGGTQKLGPGENPYAQEPATKALPKDATETYQKPGQPEYPQGESCPATKTKPARQPGKTPVKTKAELTKLVREQEAIKKKIDGRVAEIQKVQQEMNKEGLTPEQEKALTDKYWQLCEQNGKDFHDMTHYFDNYDIQSEPLTAGSLVPERP